jgi:glycosyltransferase involved in cell wall biosynthesis
VGAGYAGVGRASGGGVVMDRLTFGWGVSSFFGWGVYGMNLALQLSATRPEIALTCAVPFAASDVVLDPLRERVIADLARRSAPLWRKLAGARASGADALLAPVLLALGKNLAPAPCAGVELHGRPSIGVAFIEEVPARLCAVRAAGEFALIVAGSSWNERILRDQGVTNVVTVPQGVDTAIFHPAPKANLFPGRFVVFSGGKLEFRKGQDIVLRAFKAFHDRHKEALLLCAWGSPWPDLARQLGCPLAADGSPEIVRWAVENGIPAQAIVPVGPTPNIAMAHVIREADVALFPNRCEGGTNLAAMECMACGVMTVLSDNTGHRDLIKNPAGVRLGEQRRVESRSFDTTGWGESDPDEIAERLEMAWVERVPAAGFGDLARFLAPNDWPTQIGRLMAEIAKVT